MILCAALGLAWPVHAAGNDYPWANAVAVPGTGDWGYTACPNTDPGCKAVVESGYGVIDPYNYYLRNCTSWVAWRLDQHGISMGGSWGNAWQWKAAATGKGYVYNTTPTKGAIAYWDKTNARHSVAGHVGYVEDIPTSTTVVVSQYNSAGTGVYSQPTYDLSKTPSSDNDKPDGYIHIEQVSTSAPGGSWLTATPADLSFVSPGKVINLQSRGIDNSGSGLSKVNITSYKPAGSWGIIKSTTFPAGTTTGDASASTIMPDSDYILVSFDAYSNNGVYKLAPNGVRKYCNALRVTSCTHTAGEGGTSLPGQGGSVVCTTPPETASSVNGVTPGNNGWWRSTATVTLSAMAPCGGASPQTYYRINGGSQANYSGPITLNQQGVYTVSYYSVDGIGNTETTKTVTVRIDWTPPVTSGAATGPRDTNGIFRDNVTVGLNATDNLSGVDYERYSLNGGGSWTNVSGANNSFILNGNGISRAQYYSVDLAGNTEQPPKDSGPIIINKYVIFSNANSQSLRFLNNTNTNISGDIFTNGTTNIDWNTGGTYGTTFSTVGTSNTIGMFNTNIQVPPIHSGAAAVPMLAYPLNLYQSLANVVFPSDLKLDSVGSSLNSTIYVNGNVDMYDVGLNGPVSVVATGSINDYTTDSSYQTNDPNNGVLLYAGKDINLNSTGNRNLGLLYAPNGIVKVASTNLTLNGSLVGGQVEVNATSGFRLSYNPAFNSSSYPLPLAAMGLVKPSGTLPALPGVPSLLKPVGGTTVSKSGALFGWNASSAAFGYQLQVSKSASFSPNEYDASQLSTTQKINLASSATTYYWRVRAINQAGMSGWSTTGSFRTQ